MNIEQDNCSCTLNFPEFPEMHQFRFIFYKVQTSEKGHLKSNREEKYQRNIS